MSDLTLNNPVTPMASRLLFSCITSTIHKQTTTLPATHVLTVQDKMCILQKASNFNK